MLQLKRHDRERKETQSFNYWSNWPQILFSSEMRVRYFRNENNTLNFGSHISTVCYGSAISSLRTQCLSCTRHSFCHTSIIVLQCSIFVEHATVKSCRLLISVFLDLCQMIILHTTPLCLTRLKWLLCITSAFRIS